MRFSIRDILWLTILAATAVAWWLDHRAGIQRQRKLQNQFQQAAYGTELMRAEQALNEANRALSEAAIAVEQASQERETFRESDATPSPR